MRASQLLVHAFPDPGKSCSAALLPPMVTLASIQVDSFVQPRFIDLRL